MGSGISTAGMTLANIYEYTAEGNPIVGEDGPVIQTTPAPVFTEGTAASYDLLQHAVDPNGDTLTLAMSGTLPQGISLSGNSLVYDGVEGATSSAGHVLTATDPGGLSDSSSAFTIVVNAVTVETTTAVPNLQNAWGGTPTTDIENIHDDQHPWYLWGRTAMFASVQMQGAFTTGTNEREPFIANWTALHNDNPLNHLVLHMFPTHNIPGFRTEDNNQHSAITNWALSTDNVTRNAVALSLDGSQSAVFYGNDQTASTDSSKQVGWNINLHTEAVRDKLAEQSCDLLTGRNISGHYSWADGEGGDVSSFMHIHHDGSDVIQPKDNDSLLKEHSTGTIVSILSVNSQQPIEIRISGQLSKNDGQISTSGYVPSSDGYNDIDPSSYLAFEEPHQLWILPAGNRGFIGFHILGIKYDTGSSGNNTDLFIKKLSDTAHSTQLHTPAAGERYTINSVTEREDNVDYDRDGIKEDKFNAMMNNWATGFDGYWDLLRDKVKVLTGHGTGRGCNTGSGSAILKKNSGLKKIHGQYEKFDWIQAEDMNGTAGASFSIKHDEDSAHEYDISKYRPNVGMKSLSFLTSFIAPQPTTTFMTGKLRKAMCEFKVWGDKTKKNTPAVYDSLNEVDASYLRFCWGVTKVVPNMGFMAAFEGSHNYPIAIEECFIDLDTNYTAPEPVGTYYPEQGGTGSNGFRKGRFDFKVADSGEKIYLRRIGNWLLAINFRDDNSYTTYAPSHLNTSTSYTSKDKISAAAFSKLYTDEVLAAGETLQHFKPSTYVNDKVTTWLKEQTGSTWGEGHYYGPRQEHPADKESQAGSKYSLATAPFIARDDTKNDGSIVNTDADYILGPIEAVVWEIKPPSGSVIIDTPEDPVIIDDSDIQFVAQHNTFGGSVLGNIKYFWDDTKPHFIYARLAQWVLAQQQGLFGGSDRANEWVELKEDNPLLFAAMHGDSLMGFSAWRRPATAEHSRPYDFAITKDWKDVLLVEDATSNVLNPAELPISAGEGERQVNVHLRISSATMRRYLTKFWHDFLTGGSMVLEEGTGIVREGPDISDFSGPFHDTTSISQLRGNQQIYVNAMATGTVDSLRSTVQKGDPKSGAYAATTKDLPTHARVVRIDSQPTSDCIGHDVMFYADSSNIDDEDGKGFIGYEIEDYEAVSGGKSDITLKLIRKAHNTQLVTPSSGMLYCIFDTTDTSGNLEGHADWRANGTQLENTGAAPYWIPEWKEYFKGIDDLIDITTGHPSGVGWNGMATGFSRKDDAGWTTPHDMTESSDYCIGENAAKAKMRYVPTSTPNEYTISSADIETNMKFYHYGSTYKREPSDWMKQKAHGIACETIISVQADKNLPNPSEVANEVSASLARFHYAIMKTVPGIIPSALTDEGDPQHPFILEEWFLDFTTNWKTPDTLGTYRENDTAISAGTRGPKHSFTMATADWGTHGYVRRYGNTLCIMNCAPFSAFSGYGTVYNPSHLTNTYTPHTFTTSDQAALRPSGGGSLLTEGESLRRYDFDTYYNDRITQYLRTHSSSWTSAHRYGPNQPSPFDYSVYSVSGHPFILRDSILNTGANVSTTDTILLGPHEAIFLEIY